MNRQNNTRADKIRAGYAATHDACDEARIAQTYCEDALTRAEYALDPDDNDLDIDARVAFKEYYSAIDHAISAFFSARAKCAVAHAKDTNAKADRAVALANAATARANQAVAHAKSADAQAARAIALANAATARATQAVARAAIADARAAKTAARSAALGAT